MRHINCRKDPFLRLYAPALEVLTLSLDGFWLGSTLFDNVTTDMKIHKEEIFGPVLSCVHMHAYGEEGVRFFTKQKSIMQRWPESIGMALNL
jgi:acyl-CoA reductase-like NAD-dependent aldehyde dehydrogenase